MLIKMIENAYKAQNYTICRIEPTGELLPVASVMYRGEKEASLSLHDRKTKFILEQVIPESKKKELSEIFGDANSNTSAVEAQKAMYEAFVDEYQLHFTAALENTEKPASNEPPSPPVYFYQIKETYQTHEPSDIFKDSLRNEESRNKPLIRISVFSGEETNLCDIYTKPEHAEASIRAVQKTIMSFSSKAALDINDLFKKPRGDAHDGPGGVK